MEATKRMLQEGYQEADRVKRRRSIQTIREEEGKLLEQEQCKMHASHRLKRSTLGFRTWTSSGVSRSRARPPPPHVLLGRILFLSDHYLCIFMSVISPIYV
jgi:hypothetical protein